VGTWRPWIIAGAIGLVLALGITAWARVSDRAACREWQEIYEEARDRSGDGVFDYINVGPLAALRKERPPDCPNP
jgi:hypothetical protein